MRMHHAVDGTDLSIITDEPKDFHGEATGPNPMQCFMTAVQGCDWEEACLIATDEMKIEGFSDPDVIAMSRVEALVNLDGFMGCQQESMDATDIMRYFSIQNNFKTNVPKATLEKLRQQVIKRCPMHRLLSDGGVEIQENYAVGDSLPAPTEAPTQASEGASMAFQLAIVSECGPLYQMVSTMVDKDSGEGTTDKCMRFQVAEPVEDGGTGKGANPMHHLMAGLTGCMNNLSTVIALEMDIAVKDWAQTTWTSTMEINLDGYMGVTNNAMKASDIYRSMTVNAVFTGPVTQEQVDTIKAKTLTRCPITRIFESAGVHVIGSWTKQ